MNSKRIISSILTSLFILVVLRYPRAAAQEQPVALSTGAVIKPALQVRIPPPRVRTWMEMETAAAEEVAAAAAEGVTAPSLPEENIPFLPTMGDAAYKAYKTRAGQDGALRAPEVPGSQGAVPLAPSALTSTINFDGVDSITAGNLRPPDTHGAAGLSHFVEITNSHLDIYQKAAPNTRVAGLPLSAFFGYTTRLLYDPRVIYDQNDNRWIMSSVAKSESTAVQRFFFAVSLTADPLGAYYIYQVNVSNGIGGIWDFPQLGLDRNAVIFTANFFTSAGGFIDARMFAVAKSLLYSGPGQPLTPYMFIGLAGTLSPPLVLDENPNTYLVAAENSGNTINIYTLTNSAADEPTLSGPATIEVPPYSLPPDAPQPGTGNTLDTSDCRFVNAGTQIGDSLFQVHTINSGGLAKCRFYEFDTVNRQVIQTGTFGRSDTSFDFNASIAANRSKDVFVTWSSTDVPNNVNAEVRFSGRLHTDPVGVIPSPGSLLYGSSTYYSVSQRWGDYSAVSLDPIDPSGLTAWIVNERILSNDMWGSRIGRIGWSSKRNSLPAIYFLLFSDCKVRR